jgi:methylamine---glutamate N-methyltransferase subunit A
MCGIVGLFLKDDRYSSKLGCLLEPMLVSLSDRGPDSAGFAVYGDGMEARAKITVHAPTGGDSLERRIAGMEVAVGAEVDVVPHDDHSVLVVPKNRVEAALAWLASRAPDLDVMSTGERIEIYKDVGHPAAVAKRYDLTSMRGTHAIGHTRMATESAIVTNGAHPYSTGLDQCLVHNGSLSNHNSLRRRLVRDGFTFSTDNDTEVAAAYLSWRMCQGMNLGEALQASLSDLDGFYTFVVGTDSGFGVLRDPVACKPAVMAETESYVAFGTEYRALVELPDIDRARVWEPDPARVYFWERSQ